MARNVGQEEFVGQKAAADFLGERPWPGRNLERPHRRGLGGRRLLCKFEAVRLACGNRRHPRRPERAAVVLAGPGSRASASGFSRYRRSSPCDWLANNEADPGVERSAEALGRGDTVRPIASPLREVNRVGDALTASASALGARTAELSESEALKGAILESALDCGSPEGRWPDRRVEPRRREYVRLRARGGARPASGRPDRSARSARRPRKPHPRSIRIGVGSAHRVGRAARRRLPVPARTRHHRRAG